MKLPLQVVLVLLCLGFCSSFTFAQPIQQQLPYFHGNLDQLRLQAKSAQKPYILFFHADWSQPSREVETACLTKGAIQGLLKKNFLTLKVELDSRANSAQLVDLADRYHVTLYPTFIFFSPEGQILKKLVGQINPETFEKELMENYAKSLDLGEQDINGNLGENESSWIPNDFFPEEEEALVVITPDQPTNNQVDIFEDEFSENQTEELIIEDANQPSTNQELEGPAEMFAVQLGAFSKYAYAKEEVDKILGSSTFPAQVYEQFVNGRKYYKVIIGPYFSKGKAEQQKQYVLRELGGDDPFIITIPRY